jgi:serine/threonine-protein kinase
MSTEELNAGWHPALSMSPDGTILAYNPLRIPPMLRHMDGSFHALVPGLDPEEGGGMPFFSPDGKWIGLFQRSQLKKVPLTGGTPITLADAVGAGPWAASWGDDGTIIFNYGPGGLKRVSANGGEVEELAKPDVNAGEMAHQFPDVLPGSEAVLFTSVGLHVLGGEIGLHHFESGETRVLGPGTTPRYAESGHIVFYRDGFLRAMPFDLETLTVRGDAVPVVEDVFVFPSSTIAQFDISPTGTLVYIPWSPDDVERNLVWVDRSGAVQRKRTLRRDVGYPRFSPDGKQFLVTITERLETGVWISDISRDTLSPVTQAQGDHAEWAPDGTVTFSRAGLASPYRISLDAPADGRALTHVNGLFPSSWSPDGDVLAVLEVHPETSVNIWTVSASGNGEPQPFETGEGWQSSPEFSPDGRYIAHVSDDSGRMQVYVRPFPGPGRRVQVSTERAIFPLWHPSGRELFFVQAAGGRSTLMAVDVTTTPSFEILSEPREILSGDYEWQHAHPSFRNFDISPDGETFLMIESVREFRPTTVTVVLNWFQELERLAPAER